MSYRKTDGVERRAGRVRFYNGATRVGVVFLDGTAVAMPAEPFLKVGLAVGAPFLMIVTRDKGKVTNVAITAVPPPRATTEPKPKATPKVYDRVGRGLVTRKKPAP